MIDFEINETGGGGAGCIGDASGNAGGHRVALADDEGSDWAEGRGGHSTIDGYNSDAGRVQKGPDKYATDSVSTDINGSV